MIKFRYCGGEEAPGGEYWNFTNGERFYSNYDNVLPGNKNDKYYKIPVIRGLVLASLLGIGFAALLPAIGIIVLLQTAMKRFFMAGVDVVVSMASFGWRPREAYLSGRMRKR